MGAIRFLTGPLAGITWHISQSVVTIGREPTNDIVIEDPSVSRQHARLVNDGGQWRIENLTQQNVVTVNQRSVQQAIISDRDIIGIGASTTFLFLTSPELPGTDISQPVSALSPQQLPPQSPFEATQAVAGSSLIDRQSFTAPVPPSVADGTPSLQISSNIHPETQTFPLTQEVTSIGRDPDCDLVINEPIVSAFHAQVVRKGNQLLFTHPHPARGRTLNGVIYQGRHIGGDEQLSKPLTRGDVLRIGDENGTMVTIAYDDGSGSAQEIVPEIRPIPLNAPVITLGRLPENLVQLSHPQVSARHARLEQIPAGGYCILDLNSTNHVYVNGQRVSQQGLRPGDEIRIGPYRLTYTGMELTRYDESKGVRIDALHLVKVGSKNVVLINDISIAILPRTFVCVVGGSGAGKSVLMDALNGLRPAQKGVVLYNGVDYYRHLAAFSSQLGYVPQDEIIHRDLTVERGLYYTARLRLPDDFTQAQIKQRIDEVLEDVEMQHRRGMLVSTLSGGERKRVSIAMELLSNPTIFFLDEPTSGLDPGLDRKMMFLLRKLADKGHTIVLATHATNNINACDAVCFLAQGGRLAYFGPPNEAKTYFGKTDFAEIYSALEPSDSGPHIPEEAEERFKASSAYQRNVIGPLNQGPGFHMQQRDGTGQAKSARRGNPWKQFSVLSTRYLELLKNDVGTLLILLLQAPLIGLILILMLSRGGYGTFGATSIANCPNVNGIPQATNQGATSHDCTLVLDFLNSTPQGQAYVASKGNGRSTQAVVQDFILPGSGFDAQKYLFIMAFAAMMFGCVNGAREIVKEAPIYRRERAVNLGMAPYMFSKIVVLGTLCLLQSAVLLLMVNVVAPIQQGIVFPALLEVYITLALTSLAGLMVGLTISSIVPTNDRAVSFIPIILIPQVIFSGLLFSLSGPLLQAFGSLFAVRWAMAAAGSSVGIHGDKLNGDPSLYQGTLFSSYTQEQATFHLLLSWFALIAMIVILVGAIAFFLKRKDVRA